jgi:energy-coupling factor transport system ATP-binding protein
MRARAEGALAAVGLAGFAARDPTTLSGGEKQRLAIAGLLALRPRIMLLDEPTTDLDPAGRAEVLRVLAGLRAEGLTLALIDHDPSTAIGADLLVLLREGRVVACGAPEAILSDVGRCAAAGVRAPDVAQVLAGAGIPEPTLDLETAATLLRRRGLAPTPPPAESAVRPPGPPRLVLDGLGHRYATGREALRGVSLAIHGGEFVALVGRNGSGKTTLAKHLNGLLRPTAGRVLLDGADLQGMALEQVAQRVGYVFQDPDHQLFAPSVAEEVAFGPENLGLPRHEVDARAREVLAATGLGEPEADPFLLDKGARQRLAVAAVLALRPDVLVLDEPTTGLDHAEQQRMLALLRRLHAAGRTIVIITHTPWVIAEHAERVLLLADGELRYDGPVRGFFAEPDLVAAASFRAPEVTRLGQLLGCVPLSVAELLSWMRR